MKTYRHVFTGRAPRVHWSLILEDGEVIASGVATTKDRAWEASIAALPPMKTGREAIEEMRRST